MESRMDGHRADAESSDRSVGKNEQQTMTGLRIEDRKSRFDSQSSILDARLRWAAGCTRVVRIDV
jgi:hypothetical protein